MSTNRISTASNKNTADYGHATDIVSALVDFSDVTDPVDLCGLLHEWLRPKLPFRQVDLLTWSPENETFHCLMRYCAGDHADPRGAGPVEPQTYRRHTFASLDIVANREPFVTILSDSGLTDYLASISDWLDSQSRFIATVGLVQGQRVLGLLHLFFSEEPSDDAICFLPYLSGLLSASILRLARNREEMQEINKRKQRLEVENSYLHGEIIKSAGQQEIIGSGPEVQKVYHLLSQVAATNSTVLVMGETGTGKELVARAIHNNSPRKERLMVKVNCAALPAGLIESELFGHERGSFTGAHDRRIGKFELAQNGTLFLDEIGEMPLDLQVKLLRAIQEREIERVGGKTTLKVDVRLIAATNRDLLAEVKAGNFRSDLYYRLNVFPIHLPPLRQRKEDIPLLAGHFVQRFARNAGKKIAGISKEALNQLMEYHWPGNIRELEHLIERSVLLTSGNTIREVHLPVGEIEVAPSITEDAAPVYRKTLEETERDYILEILAVCNGKIFGPNGAAYILGLPASTLNTKLKKLGITKDDAEFTANPKKD